MRSAQAIMGGLAVVALYGCQSAEPPLETRILPGKVTEAPAMCPWRDPTGDRKRFFPDADGHTQETLILSSLRLDILKRLGPHGVLESNALYLYRVHHGKDQRGTVLVRRTAGEFGVIEVVVAVDPSRRIVGVRLQRHREPPEVAAALESPAWLGVFRGKTASDPLEIGNGLPEVPTSARKSAEAVAQAVRSLLIEYDVAETHHRGNHHGSQIGV